MDERAGVYLDRSSEPWVGVFPTLGTVRVHDDGSVDVDVEPDDGEDAEDPALREAALRHGWGEPLSLVRQGYQCVLGTGLVPPDGHGCLVLRGSVHDMAVVLAELVGLGWSVLADRIVPTNWNEGELVAFPRSAPVLVSQRRARRVGLEWVPVRADTDAAAVDVPRAQTPQPVLAVAEIGDRRPDETVFEEVAGHERFTTAAHVMVRGVMGAAHQSSDAEPRDTMRNHIALATLPYGRLRLKSDTVGADVAALVQWWSSAASAAADSITAEDAP